MPELPFKAPSDSGPLIETSAIQVLDYEGFRVTVEVPAEAYDILCKIARAAGEDPRHRLARLSMRAYNRYHRRSSIISDNITSIRSRVST